MMLSSGIRLYSCTGMLLLVIFLMFYGSTLAQPTGHQKLYLHITDGTDTIPFENSFDQEEMGRKIKLDQHSYQLIDISADANGFQYYPRNECIHKTLMSDDHRLRIIRNKKDTMDVEIFNAFKVYYLCISFRKGLYRMYVNDNKENSWLVNTLPFKEMKTVLPVYDLTPKDWSPFEVTPGKIASDYFISVQFKKQQLLFDSVLPEDDPNFRHPRRMNNLRLEVEDYNFDGLKDYREHRWNDTTHWNYFIFNPSQQGYVLDTLMSTLDQCYFNFQKQTFVGSRTTQVSPTLTRIDNYEYVNGKITLVRQLECIHISPHSERMDCSVYVLENGQMILKEVIKGCE